jgi:hypothetical protein
MARASSPSCCVNRSDTKSYRPARIKKTSKAGSHVLSQCEAATASRMPPRDPFGSGELEVYGRRATVSGLTQVSLPRPSATALISH